MDLIPIVGSSNRRAEAVLEAAAEAALGRRSGGGGYLPSLAAALAAGPSGDPVVARQPLAWRLGAAFGRNNGEPGISPHAVAAFDALFVVSLLVALLCAGVLARGIPHNGLWPCRAPAPSSSSESKPFLVVLAAHETTCAEPSGFKLLS